MVKLRSTGVSILLVSIFLGSALNCSNPENIRKRITPSVNSRNRLVRDRNDLSNKKVFTGLASFYGPGFHGKKTANGEIFDSSKMTAAHRNLPFGTICRVTNLENGKSVVVRINDRGPFVPERILDLSQGAAHAIGGEGKGVIEIRLEILQEPE